MFEAIGYEVSYRDGFVKGAFGNQYAQGLDDFVDAHPLKAAIRRAQDSVLCFCKDSAVTLTEIDIASNGYRAAGFRIMVIVRKDEHTEVNLNLALQCFEKALDWQEWQEGPYVALNRDFRTVEWEVNPPPPHFTE